MGKVISAAIILQLFCWSCSSKKNEQTSSTNSNVGNSSSYMNGEQVKVVKITLSTLDGQSSVVFGDDSYKVKGKITTRFDSIYTTADVLSNNASMYVVDFINKNLKDSVREGLSQGQYFLMISLYGVATKNLELYLQPKTDNNFLDRLIDTIEVSKHQDECASLTSKLIEYNKIYKMFK